jgi:hypothetical protein
MPWRWLCLPARAAVCCALVLGPPPAAARLVSQDKAFQYCRCRIITLYAPLILLTSSLIAILIIALEYFQLRAL